MKAAGVEFAILGQEETCTGDPARRAGNEYLYTMLAEQNVATLNGYKEQGGAKTIVTSCPHCFNSLLNEYPDFGGKYEVVHHSDFLLGLVTREEARPAQEGRVEGGLPRLVLPRPLQRRVRSAARSPEAHPRRHARRSLDEPLERSLLRRGRRADVDGRAEQGPHERAANAAAGGDRGQGRSPAVAPSA